MPRESRAYLDFGTWGAPGWHEMSTAELSLILAGAQDMADAARADPLRWQATLEMMRRSESDLLCRSITSGINEEWCTRAALAMALRGVMLGEMPAVKYCDE